MAGGVCVCPRAVHRHGHPLRHREHGCNCPPCLEAWKHYRAGANATPRVPAAPIVAHLVQLEASGMTLRAVAVASGIPYETVRGIPRGTARGRFNTTTRMVADSLLAIEPSLDPRTSGLVDATATRRRLQALAVMGWRADEVAAAVGCHSKSLQRVRHGRARYVQMDTERRVARAYRELTRRAPRDEKPNRRARTQALAAGWVSPMAWDADTIHNPQAHPFGVTRAA